MPLRAHHLPPRSTARARRTRAVETIPFDDLVYLLAEGVADAQTALDRHTAEMLETLSETAVDVTPSVTRTIEPDGSVTTMTDPAESRSLLELGLTPARYQFSDATVEVELDVAVTEQTEGGDDPTHGSGDKRTERSFELQADTQAGVGQRRFDREIGANARLTARLQPTPLPTRLQATDGRTAPEGATHAD